MDLQPLFDLVSQHRWPLVAALVIGCLVRALKDDITATPTLPARWRPVVSIGLGLLSGVGEGLSGKPWVQALIGGLLAGLLPVSANEVLVEGLLGQRTKLAAKSASVPPPAAPPAPPAASPPARDAGRPPGSMLMRRSFVGSACVAAVACAGAALCGCSAAPVVVEVATVVTVAATLAETAVANVTNFVNAYFAIHADAALQATIDAALQRAKDAAAALVSLGNGATYVAEADYLQALAAFQAFYADLLDAIKGLPMAQVVLQSPGSSATMGVAPTSGVMTLVAIPPSAFGAPKGAKKVTR